MPIFNSVYKSFKEWWQPWANTIAYYPLTSSSTVNDMKGSWTAYNLTSTGTAPSFWIYWWVDCAYFSNSWMLYNWDWTWTALWDYTISLFYNKTADVPQDSGLVAWLCKKATNGISVYADILDGKTRPTSTKWIYWLHDATGLSYVWPYSISWWTHIVITLEWSVWKLYINWEQKWSTFTIWNTTPDYIAISRYQANWDNLDRSIRWYVSEVIFENKARTADEITNYYNWTKWDYGL